MTERERIIGLPAQIELAQKYLDQWPEWLRSSARFSGSNHGLYNGTAAEEQPFSDPDHVAA